MSGLKLRAQLVLVALALVAGFSAFGFGAFRTLGEVKVGGPIYQRIVGDKDLVADILPPPNYIIESYLTALLLTDPAHVDDRPALIARLGKLRQEYAVRHEYWAGQPLPEGLRDVFLKQAHEPAMAFYRIADESLLPAVRSGDAAGAQAALRRMEAEYARHRVAIDEVVTRAGTAQAAEEASSSEAVARAGWLLAGIFVASLAIAGVANYLFSVRLLSGIAAARGSLDRMAAGDLAAEAVSDRADEIGDLQRTLAATRGKLRDLVGRIRASAEELAAAVDQLSAAATQVAASSGRQSDDVASVAATVEEMSVGITHMAGLADESRATAGGVGELCSRGSDEIGSTASSVERLTADVQATSTSVTRLGEESRRISDIVGAIRSIADQTNLLALNAAIEAARAGEQGRGFAVVADEVRKLAERTAQSTDEITGMIASIHAEIQTAVGGMAESCDKAGESVAAVHRAKEAMDAIATATGTLVGEIDEIAGGLGSQREGSASIAGTVERISVSAVDNSQAMEQLAATARGLAGTARGLKESVSAFSG